MNEYVLDTHVWIWLISNPEKVPPRVHRLLNDRARYSRLLLSSISLWEFCKLIQKGRLQAVASPERWLQGALSIPKLSVQDITASIAIGSTTLPQPFHKDPADELIVATAREFDAILLTADRKLLSYPHVRTFW
jgi:PIN domain nuclease of toxin-antitoxin system